MSFKSHTLSYPKDLAKAANHTPSTHLWQKPFRNQGMQKWTLLGGVLANDIWGPKVKQHQVCRQWTEDRIHPDSVEPRLESFHTPWFVGINLPRVFVLFTGKSGCCNKTNKQTNKQQQRTRRLLVVQNNHCHPPRFQSHQKYEYIKHNYTGVSLQHFSVLDSLPHVSIYAHKSRLNLIDK